MLIITGTSITEIFPKDGSIAGETRLSITGSGFSQDTLNQGNEVQLVSDRAAYACPVHKDGTTEDMVMCYTPPNMPEGYYWVRLKVDGNDVPDSRHCGSASSSKCRFRVTSSATPTITSVEPTSGAPGSILKINGRMYTDRYGSNVDESTNGRTERILRVYAATQECSLKYNLDTVYGLALDNSGGSNNGHMKCKLGGTLIGNHNASFIIEGAFGRSLRDSNALHVYSNDQIALFQTYAEITSISPSAGSISGGTLVTITGVNFDDKETKAKTSVKIEGTDCVVQSVTTTQIVCQAAAQPSVSVNHTYTGNRGLLWESWNTTSKSFSNIDDVGSLLSSASDYASSNIQEANFVEEAWDNYVKIAFSKSYTNRYTKFADQSSSRMRLEKGNSYYMEVHHLEGSVGAYAKVAARLYDTTFTNQTTGKATPETQLIKITSNIVKEVQNITVSGLSSTTSAVNEVQEVTITENSGGLSTATYRLGLYGAYTVPLTTGSTDLEIGEALKALPIFHSDESVTVSSTIASSGVGSVLTITFSSERGDFPALTYKTARGTGGETLGVSVTEKTNGVPSGKFFTVKIANIPSPLIKADASDAEVETALNAIFGARCPKTLTAPSGARKHYTFEDSLPAGVGGTKYTKTEAFCGKAVLRNPWYLYRDDEGGLSLGQSLSTLCFAYKGAIQNRTKLWYTYEDSQGEEVSESNTFDTTYKTSSDWAYSCFDMRSALSAHRSSGSNFKVTRIQVFRVDTEVFFDEVYIGRSSPLSDPDGVNKLRMPQATLNGVVIDSVSVKKYSLNNGNQVYEVTFSPLDCGCNFPKFSSISGQVKSGASISVSRPVTASCAIGGTFDLSFKGTTARGIQPSATADELHDILKAVPSMGELYIYKHGECDGEIMFSITFLSLPGDQESIVATNNLVGVGVSVAVETENDGSLWFDPIQGDMLRTVHDKPQVLAYINTVPTKCSGDCTYEWTSGATPTITSISPTSGNPGVAEVTITGTGFSGAHANNAVTIGNTACTTKSSTSTQIVCDVGDGPKGTYPVQVAIQGTGSAQNSGNSVTFTYNFQISGATPTTCSIGGGCALTLSGFGLAADDVVAIGNVNNTCATSTRSTTQIVCAVPSSTVTTAQDIMVVHSDGTSTVYGGGQFTYSSAGIPRVSSFTPSTSSVLGGDPLTLTGTNFDTSGSLDICGTVVTPTTFTSTQVVATLPAKAAGPCQIKLISTNGIAIDGSSQIPSVDYDFRVKNVYPRQGSLYGGTRLTVTGSGFSTNTSITSVRVGSNTCAIDSVTSTKIVCTIEDTAAVHPVDNSGIHYVFMEGYEWNPKNVRVRVGDIVRWSWSYPSWVAGMTPRLTQVSCNNMTNEISGGFSSGPTGTKNGAFEHRFTSAGTFCFWSGYVDIYKTTQFSGVVEVVDRTSSAELVSVMMGGQSALHDINSGVADPVDSSSCPMSLSTVSGCSDAAPTGGDPTKFTFAFYSCATPTVTAISPNSGTTNTAITITGTGFSSTKCHNEVKFGSNTCIVSSASESEIQCSIDSSTSPQIGVLEEVSFRLQNLGNALIPIASQASRSFGLNPLVTEITPSRGSKAGGTRVVLKGTGFVGTVNDVQATIGGYSVDIVDVSYNMVVINTKASAGGDKALDLQVRMPSGTFGSATCAILCQFVFDPIVTPEVTSVTPTSLTGASTTVTLTGSKFGSTTTTSDLTVTIGGESCTPTSVSDTSIECTATNVPAGSNAVVVNFAEFGLAEGSVTITGDANGFLVCVTPSHAAAAVKVTVTSNGQTYAQQDLTYDAGSTPDITSISPTVGSAGTTLVLTGTNFGATNGDNMVLIDGTQCTVTSSSPTSVSCTIGSKAVGTYNVLLKVNGKGDSNNDKTFEYQLAISGINPASGSTSGGQTVTVSGSGFDSTVQATVCGTACTAKSGATQTTSQYVCVTPDSTNTVTQSCDVVVTQNSVSKTLASGYTYDSSITPEITGVSPARGGTGGGTTLTVTGSGFGIVPGDVSVTLEGNACTVSTITDTQIVCTTSAASSTVRTKVRVERSGNGIAKQTSADFQYIDVWSSTATWGGLAPPTDGDLVVIEKGHSILLDTNTAKMKMLLIKGGELIFDEQDLTLDAENILVTEGGLFQIGTEAEPFQHKATVFLRGHHRTKELPIYGTKNLGIREGRLELHGKYVPVTWTRLASTAAAGSNTIVLQDEVTWEVGDHLAIATTNHRHSQIENEERVIASVAGDKKTITLTQPLTYEHLGVSETFDGTTLDFRAEVGLLTHNVKVEGYSDPQWNDTIEACPDGFDTGEFATQTCFQGRFGEEIGSDQFGAHILIHAPRPNANLAVAHIENIEVKHGGQAFRLGRYPIHFHLLGDMTGSYVKRCSIHETFNRAHFGAQILTIPTSTTLRQAGTHFGFWYRMHTHPDGPSFTTSVCGRHVELGKFYNNTVHSQGWFGLWIFETYTPRLGSGCGSTTTTPAVFDNIFVWNCEKGVEFVNSGTLQLVNSYLVNNKLAGFEVKLKVEGPDYTDDTLLMKNTMVVGHATSLTRTEQGCTRGAVVIPYGSGFVVADSTFVNFDESNCAAFAWTRITGTCSTNCGGYTSLTKGLRFVNADNKGNYGWTFEGQIKDQDGTLIGETGNAASIAANVGKTVVTCAGVLPPSCTSFPKFSVGQSACVCPSNIKLHRFAFNNPSPKSLEYKNIILTTQYGTTTMPWKKKSISHPLGWHTVNVGGEETTLEFENADHITNVSFTGVHYEFDAGDYVVMKHNIAQRPDRFFMDGKNNVNESLSALDPATSCTTGDWEYDGANSMIKYSICGDPATGRKKRGSPKPAIGGNARSVTFSAYKCYFPDCIPPPDPNTLPPPSRPAEPQLWSNVSLWNTSDSGAITNNGAGQSGLPQDGDSVTIVKDTWILADVTLPNIHTLVLYGTLELDSANGTRDFVLNCTYIVILGGRLVVGTPTEPFLSNAHIILNGDHSTPGVFGGLDLHGKDVGVTWTTLASTANVGDNTVTLSEPVEWQVGNDIVVTPTGYSPWEAETFRITAVSVGKTVLTLNDTLRFRHISHTESGNGHTMEMKAEVGLLSRNIKIEGADYSQLYEESFGARILVSRAQEGSDQHIGYARISNVEFYHTGQEGWVESYDPRYSIAFVDSGAVTSIKPSYIKKCAFHHGFAPAVGVYGANGLPIEDNVAHSTVWWCMETNSDNTQFRRNLCTLVQWEGSYLDRAEPLNVRYNGAFSAIKATNLIFEGNRVAGTERMGFALPPESCTSTPTNPYMGNEVHTALLGLAIHPKLELTWSESCLKYSNFTIWKCVDYGVYINHGTSMVVDQMKLADNKNNIYTFVSGPAALSHAYADKTTTITNSLIVGRSSSFDCTADVIDSNDVNIQLSGNSRPCVGGAHMGIVISTFSSGSNNAPVKPFCGIMSYQAIKGQSYIRDVTFSRFQAQCGQQDRAIVPPQPNDDGIHPLEVSGLTFIDTPSDNKYRNGRANVGAINSADCVDMACDGLLKVLVDDIDGTFLGTRGMVISQSEFEYNGDRRRGLGDYRIPKEMLTRLDGTRIPYRTLAPYQGIIRNPGAVYNSAWQAYQVHGLEYKMMTLESLDSDTETRRLSPIAVLSDGYLDLINGPQDHGWCSGYTCRKRLSTFPIIVASGKNYLIHYTSTSPQDTRFMLLNSNSSHAVRLSIWYAHPNRLDLYVDGTYIMPKNGRMEGPTNDKKLILDPPPQSDPDYYMPVVGTDSAGANFFSRNSGIFTFLLVGGNSEYIIKTQNTIIVSHQFPPMTVDEFFGQNIVQNLAAFLNIPASKVRVTDVIPENQAAGKRKKRATGSDVIVGAIVEVGNAPNPDINGTVSGDLTDTQITDAGVKISNEIQLGNYSEIVNTSSSTTYSIATSPPSTDSEEWANQGTESPYTVLYQVDAMRFNPKITPLHEGAPFSTQPKVQILDANGNPIKNKSPWQLTATIRAGTGNPSAQLLGNTSVTFVDGWANFTGMYITHFGTDYIIDFNITDPVEGENVTLASDPLTIQGRPITAALVSKSTDIVERNYLSAVLELRDSVTSEVISDIAWRGHTWTANATLGMPELYNGTLEGSLVVTFDPSSGQAQFYSLNITNLGAYVVKFHITSNPPDYDFTHEELITVKALSHIGLVIEEQKDIVVKFNEDYNTIVGSSNNKYFAAMMGNYLSNMYQDVITSSITVVPGSIIVTFQVGGSTVNINATSYALCDSIQNSVTFNFNGNSLTLANYMVVGGTTYYGVLCGSMDTEADSDTSSILVTVLVVCLVLVVLLLAVIAFGVWRIKIRPKTKTRDISDTKYLGTNQDIEDILWREKSFMSISSIKPQAPAGTLISSYEKKPLTPSPRPTPTPRPNWSSGYY
ncbi:hypothetical protein FSP39_021797 [Pinctada imbricata]|uniref:G8 domain-containing protein n=1 Tax=Pinctada imbricata TaxID=66713 RepID=A0AA88YUF4_PINIB|nr:hypothetical protein FSP39_021797 [Pinctada imbricata]